MDYLWARQTAKRTQEPFVNKHPISMPSQKDGKEYRNSKQPGTAILLSEQERDNSGESSNLHNVDTFGMFCFGDEFI